ncbi:hypothetical protein N836_09480 [Leptolyngbya sp. Heron Island J]|uniref:hypothetical protein n=1 Tax=Leptolyngbya sp. Heron Island J TaxID=1385935 RepID=UPI0003B96F63|nr:hypothetical protein [Leptolyngbya sp. Heron Island J]ESA35940.1 hypothetical protein N836_09480 [Leptolyngbya sp. Heron Island J]
MKFAALYISDAPPKGCPPCAIATLKRSEDSRRVHTLRQWFGGLNKVDSALKSTNDVDFWVVLHNDHKASIQSIYPSANVKVDDRRYSTAISAVLSALEDDLVDTSWRGWRQFSQAVMALDKAPRHKAMAYLIAYATKWARPVFHLDTLVTVSPH